MTSGPGIQASPAAARQSWRLPRIHDMSRPPAAQHTLAEEQQVLEGSLQGCSHVRHQAKASEIHRVAALPDVGVSAAVRGNATVDAPDPVSEHHLSANELASHTTQSSELKFSSQPSAGGQAACDSRTPLLEVQEGAGEAAAAHEAFAPMLCSSPSKGAILARKCLAQCGATFVI